tara:strand:+ start:972 stop:1232 length:261 start_codon:yes stop_codon:yes gene_type:complete
MNINELIKIVKKKIKKNISCDNLDIEDKTYLHKNHKNHQLEKFHIKIKIKSLDLKKLNKIEATKKIYKVLDKELKEFIHSIQILID